MHKFDASLKKLGGAFAKPLCSAPEYNGEKKGSAHVEESATPSVKNLKRFKENRRRSLDFCDSLDGGQFRVLVFSAVLSVRSII